MLIWEYDFMKVVLVKSPKFLSGLLRMIFGIKKQSV
ncbi:MAG: stage V sporulation protein SpoVM [Clostridia bacterium]|nr:stage V sporulation protein SpoVM [Clostridia bacterium]MBR4973305.1 stage V sporulation protein SpoVM [Clostridia bacterium]